VGAANRAVEKTLRGKVPETAERRKQLLPGNGKNSVFIGWPPQTPVIVAENPRYRMP